MKTKTKSPLRVSKKSRRGGPRPGSGRPRKPAAMHVNLTVRLDAETHAALLDLAAIHGGLGRAVRALISEKQSSANPSV